MNLNHTATAAATKKKKKKNGFICFSFGLCFFTALFTLAYIDILVFLSVALDF